MKNYYIYHIPGIKIGCTVNVPHRMREQGYTEWEHLETHTDIYEASNREIELQKEYGLPVDSVPYWKAVENRYKFDSNTGREAGRKGLKTYERQSHAGKAGGRSKRSLTSDEVKAIRIERRDKNTTMLALGNKYNVTKTVVFKIIHYKSYTDPEFLI